MRSLSEVRQAVIDAVERRSEEIVAINGAYSA